MGFRDFVDYKKGVVARIISQLNWKRDLLCK